MGRDARPKVLVLEDSVLVAMAIEDELAEQGFEPIVAGSIGVAERLIAATLPAAALLDLHLPDGLPLDLAKALVARGCAVALVTGADPHRLPGVLAQLPRFAKPVAPAILVDWVGQAVQE